MNPVNWARPFDGNGLRLSSRFLPLDCLTLTGRGEKVVLGFKLSEQRILLRCLSAESLTSADLSASWTFRGAPPAGL